MKGAMLRVTDIYGRAHWINPRYVVRISAPAPGGDHYHLVTVDRRDDAIVLAPHEASDLIVKLEHKP